MGSSFTSGSAGVSGMMTGTYLSFLASSTRGTKWFGPHENPGLLLRLKLFLSGATV